MNAISTSKGEHFLAGVLLRPWVSCLLRCFPGIIFEIQSLTFSAGLAYLSDHGHLDYAFFKWIIIDIQFCISLRCITQWFRIYICCKMVTIRSRCHLSPYKVVNMIDYVPCPVHYIPGEILPFNPLHLFCSSPHLLPSGNHSVCPLYVWVWFCFVLFVHLFCFLGSA